MKNTPFVPILLALILLMGALFAWYQMSSLKGQITDLNGQLGALGERLDDAEQQAVAADNRANRAEEDAEAALRAANEAQAERELSAEQAAQAEMARRQAEERERLAAEARKRAEEAADEEAVARAQAQEEKAAAERRAAESILSADRAWAEAADAKAEVTRIRRRMQREMDRMQHAMQRIAQTRRDGLELVMTLDSSEVEFDFNKTELRPRNREVLSRIVGVLLTFDDYGVQIYGHTDDVGSVEYNQTLSEQRAQVVKDYLVEAGVDPKVIQTEGFGKTSPIVDGTDDTARQRNRRVEIGIVFSQGEYELLDDPAPAPDSP